MVKSRRGLIALSLSLAATLVAGCPGKLTDEEKQMFSGACPDIPALFAERCGLGSCHGANTPQGNLDLASPDVESRIVSVASTDTCKGAVLANPIDPEGSVIYGKLTDTPPCGSRMPFGEPLSEREIACVKEWISKLEPAASGGASSSGGGAGGGTGGAAGAGGAGGN